MRVLFMKVKEVLFSVLPITVLVLVLHFTIAPIPLDPLLRFLIGALLVVAGLSIFLFGVELAISPLGNHIGSTVSKTNKLWIIAAVGLVLGFFISIAEPDLQILARQVSFVTGGHIPMSGILVVVSAGIAIMLVAGLIRIVYNFPLYILLTILYGVIFILAFFVSPEFLAISFDASGATTGALMVPFIMALAIGISVLKKDSKASEKDSFGLVAVTSTGAILGVMLMGIFFKVDGLTGSLEAHISETESFFAPFLQEIPKLSLEAFIALLPVAIIFLVFQFKAFHFQRKPFRRILKGLLYTLIGLILFLTGVNAGFMDVGTILGRSIALMENKAYAVGIGFILGFVTILAEPAVYVLTHQIETVTSGYVKRKGILAALTIGVGLAVALSILRIVVPQIQLWHYLLPGYILSVILSFFVPKLFVGIAFDSGGVASGPMTATFILAFAQGVADSIEGADVLRDAFGMIALVAMTPIITLQIFGLIVKLISIKKGGDNPHV